MFGLNFIALYFIRKWRENDRRRRRKAKDLPLQKCGKDKDEIDGNSSDDEDIVITDRPVYSKVIMLWGVSEIISLILVLVQRSGRRQYNNNYDNFLHDFCDDHARCEGIVFRIIYFKLFFSVLLVIGAKYRMTLLMIPWIFVNVLGIFPYFHVVYSAYSNFSTLGGIRDMISSLIPK